MQKMAWLLAETLGGAGASPAGAADPGAAVVPRPDDCCAVVELRQYLMKPGRRDDLIALFDRQFLESQEQHPMRVIGQFRNRRDPDRFVWLRGFADMQARHAALTGFYDGPVWQEHRSAANDTMLDSDDVLLLRPARAGSTLRLGERAPVGTPDGGTGLVVVTLYYFDLPVPPDFVELFDTEVAPLMARTGAALRGQFVTEPAANTFTRLPVREGENVFLWIASFAGSQEYQAHRRALAANSDWSDRVAHALRRRIRKPEEVLELVPTGRSRLRHEAPGLETNGG